jgi:hypothetical protein
VQGSSRRTVVRSVGAVLMCAAILAGAPARCDRGHWVIDRLRPNVSVHNAGQKAIIGWNGVEEVLILSTDLSAEANATVLEFLPLPAKPTKVAKADARAFQVVEVLIANHAPRKPTSAGGMALHRGPVRAAGAPPAQIVFHERIDVHDITIARVDRLEGFVTWARDFVAQHGGSLPSGGQPRLETVIRSYLMRGYRYFVFDIIEVGEKTRTVPPIAYRFPSDHLFFPLLVSTLDSGDTEVNLFLLTPHERATWGERWPDVWSTGTGLAAGFYREPGQTYTNREPGTPIKFRVTQGEVGLISPELKGLFQGTDYVARFTAATYRGPVSKLARDFVLTRAKLR